MAGRPDDADKGGADKGTGGDGQYDYDDFRFIRTTTSTSYRQEHDDDGSSETTSSNWTSVWEVIGAGTTAEVFETSSSHNTETETDANGQTETEQSDWD